MIADALGWKLEKVTDEIQPKIAEARVRERVPGRGCRAMCAGIIQDGVGYRDGEPVITLHMEAYLGAPESYDAVEITGSPALKMKIAGGVHGDIATASIAVNSLPKILEVRAGAAHHAGHADAVVLRRRKVARPRRQRMDGEGVRRAKPSGVQRHAGRSAGVGPTSAARGSGWASPPVNHDACEAPPPAFEEQALARDAEQARGFLDSAVRAFERAPHHHLFEHLDGSGHRLIEPDPHLGFVAATRQSCAARRGSPATAAPA